MDAPTQPSVVEETSPQPVTQDILPSHPANETVSPTEDTPDNGEDISQPQSPQKNKTLLYGGITVVVLAIITGIAFLVFSPKDKFSGTWRFDDQFNAAELVLDLKSDSTKGKFYYGSKEEVGFFSIDFTVGSVKVDDHTAELELLYWDDENKQIIIPATVNLRAGDQKMDITVGDENSPD